MIAYVTVIDTLYQGQLL